MLVVGLVAMYVVKSYLKYRQRAILLKTAQETGSSIGECIARLSALASETPKCEFNVTPESFSRYSYGEHEKLARFSYEVSAGPLETADMARTVSITFKIIDVGENAAKVPEKLEAVEKAVMSYGRDRSEDNLLTLAFAVSDYFSLIPAYGDLLAKIALDEIALLDVYGLSDRRRRAW